MATVEPVFLVIIVILSFFAGIIIIGFFYGIFSIVQSFFVRMIIPKNKERLKIKLKDQKFRDRLLIGQETEIDKKEVEKDDRQRSAEFRQFEKLRRAIQKKRRSEQGKPRTDKFIDSIKKSHKDGRRNDKVDNVDRSDRRRVQINTEDI